MPVQTTIKHRGSTAATWTSTNPVLAAREMGLETDTSKFKFGDGTTAWNSLSYVNPGYVSSIQHSVKAGEALTRGQAVYVSSADGTNMIVSKASNATEATSSKTMGLITSTLSTNGIGNVISEGLLSGLNTSTATAGDAVWLGTSGNLIYGISNKPVAPAHMVSIGIVTRVSSTNGEIFVKVQNGFELEELHNVLITSAVNGDLVKYDSATGLWKNAAQSTLTIAESQVTNLVSDLAGKAASSHTHGMADLTGFTITSATTGQVLTYNGTKWVNSAAPAAGFDAFLLAGM